MMGKKTRTARERDNAELLERVSPLTFPLCDFECFFNCNLNHSNPFFS